ncbi:no-associated protein 1 [Quercus suber]|uniref:No-associated protein 1 n=1 Tax=Quercus suber TaxID=58331 RepID=A0AAW0JZ92_QUESU
MTEKKAETKKKKKMMKKEKVLKVSMVVATCYGCGAPLQTSDSDAQGYVDIETNELIARRPGSNNPLNPVQTSSYPILLRKNITKMLPIPDSSINSKFFNGFMKMGGLSPSLRHNLRKGYIR